MKRVFIAILAALALLAAACGDDYKGGLILSGKVSVKENLQVFSPENNRYFKYSVILPSSFNVDPAKRYPVLYLLHGMDGSNTDWCSGGAAREAVQAAVDAGTIPEMVVIMPEALNTSYVDGYQDGIKYETFFHSTLMPTLEEMYRVDSGRTNRFVAGLSMGGFGASYYAFKYPEKFAYCYCISGAVGGMGSDLTPDIPSLVAAAEGETLPGYTMDIGTEDFLYSTNAAVHQTLMAMNFDHEYIERPGAHDWTFWKAALPKALDRIGKYLIN